MSDARWLLPQAPEPSPCGAVVRQVHARCPGLSLEGLLHWARSSRATTVRDAWRALVRAEIRRPHQGSPTPCSAKVESDVPRRIRSPREPRTTLNPALAMVEAMGVAFDGNRDLTRDPERYLLLPQDCPEGAPRVGILVCKKRLHFFVSEEDTIKATTWAGPMVMQFLGVTQGKVEVLWHLMTKRPLAYGGAPDAVAASGLPSDMGFVVWQWADDGLVAAAGYSRDYGVFITAALRKSPRTGAWVDAAALMNKANAFTEVIQPSFWRRLAASALDGAQERRPETNQTRPQAPVSGGGGDNEFDPPAVQTAPEGQKVLFLPAPAEVSGRPVDAEWTPSGHPMDTVELSDKDSTVAKRVAVLRDKLNRHMQHALLVGNPTRVEELREQLNALDNPD